jgi:hypothetical protein
MGAQGGDSVAATALTFWVLEGLSCSWADISISIQCPVYWPANLMNINVRNDFYIYQMDYRPIDQ